MLKNIYSNLLLIVFVLFVVSCEKDDTPEAELEMEVFTRATLTITNLTEPDEVIAPINFTIEAHDHDHDDDHGDDDHGDDHDGEHTVIDLETNSEYKFDMTFWDDTDAANPIDMTIDVAVETPDEHHPYYEFVDSTVSFTPAADDYRDSNGKYLNLKTIWTTTSAREVDILFYLIHEPTTKEGTTRADFGGATDFEFGIELHIGEHED